MTNPDKYNISHQIIKHYCSGLFGWDYFIYVWIHVIYLPISFRIASLALGQSHDCPSASEAILKDQGEINHFQTTP